MTAISVGFAIAACCAAGFVGIGSLTFPFPERLGAAYGAPVDTPAALALVRALGLRDVALGLALTAFVALGDARAAHLILAVTALIAAVDFGLVLALNGRLVPPLVVHAGGLALSATGAVLLALPR